MMLVICFVFLFTLASAEIQQQIIDLPSDQIDPHVYGRYIVFKQKVAENRYDIAVFDSGNTLGVGDDPEGGKKVIKLTIDGNKPGHDYSNPVIDRKDGRYIAWLDNHQDIYVYDTVDGVIDATDPGVKRLSINDFIEQARDPNTHVMTDLPLELKRIYAFKDHLTIWGGILLWDDVDESWEQSERDIRGYRLDISGEPDFNDAADPHYFFVMDKKWSLYNNQKYPIDESAPFILGNSVFYLQTSIYQTRQEVIKDLYHGMGFLAFNSIWDVDKRKNRDINSRVFFLDGEGWETTSFAVNEEYPGELQVIKVETYPGLPDSNRIVSGIVDNVGSSQIIEESVLRYRYYSPTFYDGRMFYVIKDTDNSFYLKDSSKDNTFPLDQGKVPFSINGINYQITLLEVLNDDLARIRVFEDTSQGSTFETVLNAGQTELFDIDVRENAKLQLKLLGHPIDQGKFLIKVNEIVKIEDMVTDADNYRLVYTEKGNGLDLKTSFFYFLPGVLYNPEAYFQYVTDEYGKIVALRSLKRNGIITQYIDNLGNVGKLGKPYIRVNKMSFPDLMYPESVSIVSQEAGDLILWVAHGFGSLTLQAQPVDKEGIPKGNSLSIYAGAVSTSAISNGIGGAIIAWKDITTDAVYTQFIDEDNKKKKTTSILVSGTGQDTRAYSFAFVPHNGGSIIAWNTGRDGKDIYAQFYNKDLNLEISKVQITSTVRPDGRMTMVKDIDNGAILAWQSQSEELNIQFLDKAGELGKVSPINLGRSSNQYSMVSDGIGGALIAWRNFDASVTGSGIFAQFIDKSGNLGRLGKLAPIKISDTGRLNSIVSDGKRGGVISWTDTIAGRDVFFVLLLRVDGSVTAPVVFNEGTDFRVTSDSQGGARIFYVLDSKIIVKSFNNGQVKDFVKDLSYPNAQQGLFIRGDANDDKKVDISDAVFILNFLFTSGVSPPCLDAADVDDTGVIELTDVVFLLNKLFLAGQDIPKPWPNAGIDLTLDSFYCE